MNRALGTLLSFKICFFCLLFSPASGEERLNSNSFELYLNSIKTLKADFIQISSNGEVETGQLLIKKPGKMRFEYDSPSNHLVMASGLLLVVIDKKLTSEPQRYLTSQTPIGYLLNETVKLTPESNLKEILLKDSYANILLHDPDNPTIGTIELVFSLKPMTLREWTITNFSGERIRVLLDELIINHPIDMKNFNIGSEISKIKQQQSRK